MNIKIVKIVALSILLAFTLNGCGGDSSTYTPNQVPTIDAGSDQSVNEQTTVNLKASANDTDGNITKYNWQQTDGETITFTGQNSADMSFSSPITTTELTLSFRVTATDNEGATASDTVIVTVLPVNVAPTIDETIPQTVNEQTVVELLANANDEDGQIVSYDWQQTAGPQVTLNFDSQNTASFTTPITTEELSLAFELTVIDNEQASTSQQYNILVQPVNIEPEVAITQIVDITPSSFVTLSGAASDADGEIVNTQWAIVNDNSIELSNQDSLNPSFILPADYSQTEVIVSFQATDNEGAQTTQQSIINVLPIDEFVEYDGELDPDPLEDVVITIANNANSAIVPATEQEHGYKTIVVQPNSTFNFEVNTGSLTLVGEGAPDINVNDIIVGITADNNRGYMQKVVSINGPVIYTQPAILSQAFPQADVELQIKLSNDTIKTNVVTNNQGQITSFKEIEILNFDRKLQHEFASGVRGVIDLSMNSTFEVDFKFSILERKINSFETLTKTNYTTKAYLDVELNGEYSRSKSHRFKPLFNKNKVVFVGSIPLLINIKAVPVTSVGLNVSAQTDIKYGYRVSGDIKAGFEYQNETLNKIAQFRPTISKIGPEFSIGGDANLKTDAKIEVSVSVYEFDLAFIDFDGPGVGIDLGPYAEFNVSSVYDINSDPLLNCELDLTAGIESDLTFDYGDIGDLIGIENPENINLFNLNKQLWHSDNCPFGPKTGLVNGNVIDSEGNALSGVSIAFNPIRNNKLKTAPTSTDNSGNYQSTELSIGKYNVVASKDGYHTNSNTINIQENKNSNLPFMLFSDEEEPPHDDDLGNDSDSATAMGDPHIRTFDGISYDFQGVGEYTFVKSDSGDLEIQSRTQPWGSRKDVSLNSAIAIKIVQDRVAFYTAEFGIATLIDGQLIELTEGLNELPTGGNIFRYGNDLEVVWPDQSKMKLRRRGDFLELTVELNHTRRGKISGILGAYDGKTEDELKTRQGQVINSTNINFSELYDTFGESWRVTEQSTLFDYFDDETLESFINRNFPETLVNIERIREQLGEDEYNRIQALCRNYVTEQSRLEACIIDIALTGEEEGLEAYREIAEPDEIPDIQDVPVVIIHSPGAGSVQSSNVIVRGEITTARPIQSFELSINSGERQDVTNALQNNTFVFSVSSQELMEGNNLITIYATDNQNNTGNNSISFVYDSSVAPVAGADLIVINDVNAFDDTHINNVDNIQFTKNLVNYTGDLPRSNGNIILWDASHQSRCEFCVELNTFNTTMADEGYEIIVTNDENALTEIAPEVKLIILWTPTIEFTQPEINSLKTFASQGGRILFVGENQNYYGQEGLDTENSFLANMGAVMRNLGETTLGYPNNLPVNEDNQHQMLTNVSHVQVNLVSLIELGPNDYPLLTDHDGQGIVAGVARIDVNVPFIPQSKRMKKRKNPPSPIIFENPGRPVKKINKR